VVKQRPVWGYFAVAVTALVIGVTLLLSSLEESTLPTFHELTRVSGQVATVKVVDDLSGKSSAFMTPLNSIHFTLVDNPLIFRYPSRWPNYTDVYNRLAFRVNIWVRSADLQTTLPVLVYGLQQTVPKDWIAPAISIRYEDIIAAQQTGMSSYRTPGIVLITISCITIVCGILLSLRNRRTRPIPRADQ